MANEIRVVDVIHGGAMNAGQDVFFDISAADGETFRVVQPYVGVGNLITKLQLFAAAALKDRTEGQPMKPGTQKDYEGSALLSPQGIEVCALADGTGIAIRVWLSPGVSVDVPIPSATVPELQESMTQQLDEAKRLSPRSKH